MLSLKHFTHGLICTNWYLFIPLDNQAIRSRCQLLELKPLEEDDILKGLKRVKNVLNDIERLSV